MKKRPSDQSPWMPAPTFGRSIRPGIGINLLVEDVARSVRFATAVLGATVTYADADFAVLRAVGADWMFHADHTYRDNPVIGLIEGVTGRGAGIELRLYGVDPDAAEAAARHGGYTVLAGAMDKPHGLRECIILDDDGYCWVPGTPTPKDG
jgi:catechol 2,3-dioxygenase-like lactoylglutathione lyase family enzyme